MKLMDVGIAVPFVEYHISVGCRIRRRAMIMEWVIIQMIAAALQHKEYGELPASAILRTVFGISDADRLVRPVMISMMSTGLISAAGLTDDSSLDEIRLSDCGLTDEGRLMLRDGTLPAESSSRNLQLTYDVLGQKFVPGRGLVKDPAGVQAMSADEARNIPFPMTAVQAYLADAQKKKIFAWLQAGTEISSIVPLMDENGTRTVWRNIRSRLEVGPGGSCSIKGFESPELLQRIAGTLPPMPEGAASWPVVPSDDPDGTAAAWAWPGSLADLLRERSGLFIAREKDAALVPTVKGAKAPRIVLLSDSGSFEMKAQQRQLTVRVKGSLLPSQVAVAGDGFTVRLGRFQLDFGGTRREAALAYVPRQESFDAGEIVRGVVENYASTRPDIVILLYLTHQDEAFRKKLQMMAGTTADLGWRARLLTGLRSLGEGLLGDGSSVVPDELMAELLAGSVTVRKYAASPESAGRFLYELRKIFREIRGDHRPLFEKAAQNVAMALSVPSSIADAWHIIDQLAAVDVVFQTAIEKDEECLRHLYPEAVIRDFIERLSPEFAREASGRRVQMPPERAVARLDQIVGKILSLLGGLTEEGCSAALIRKAIALDATDRLMAIHELLQQWSEACDGFSKSVMDFTDACALSPFLRQKAEFIGKVSDSLSEFSDPKELRYRNIAVPDTNALLSHPEIIDALRKDGSYLLLVPAVVLRELDGLKNSEKKDVADNSREVSRSLSVLVEKGADWVQAGVESNLDLVPEEVRTGSMQNDMRILSVALRYNASPVCLITDDNNLRLMSSGCRGIRTLGSEGFLKMLGQEGQEPSAGKGKQGGRKRK